MTRIICALLVCLEVCSGLKILMAGDQDKDRRAFFYSIAEAISSNPDTSNQIFFLTTEFEPV